MKRFGSLSLRYLDYNSPKRVHKQSTANVADSGAGFVFDTMLVLKQSTANVGDSGAGFAFDTIAESRRLFFTASSRRLMVEGVGYVVEGNAA